MALNEQQASTASASSPSQKISSQSLTGSCTLTWPCQAACPQSARHGAQPAGIDSSKVRKTPPWCPAHEGDHCMMRRSRVELKELTQRAIARFPAAASAKTLTLKSQVDGAWHLKSLQLSPRRSSPKRPGKANTFPLNQKST